MTGPNDSDRPGSDDTDADWGFPEVADPASIELPAEKPQAFDTGSDAWWRAQAQAQRRAAESEPRPAAPPVLPPASEVSGTPGPLDRDWPGPAAPVPPAAAPVPPAAEAPPAVPPAVPPVTPPVEPPVTPPSAPSVTRPVPPAAPSAAAAAAAAGSAVPAAAAPYLPPPAADDLPAEPAPSEVRDRPAYEGDRIGVGRAVAGAGLAVVGVLLGIGALLLFHGDGDKGSPTVQAPPASALVTTAPTREPTQQPTQAPTQASTPAATKAPAPPAVPAQAPVVPVSVLNNSRIKGLASTVAARFRAGGWPVPLTGNYSGGTIATTTVYFAPGEQASAERFARQFGIPRVAPRFPGLPTHGMTVVLTRDYR